MTRVNIAGWVVLSLAPALSYAAAAPATAAALPAATIVERNVAARGGLAAWQAVRTMSSSGKIEAGGNNQRYLKTPGAPKPAPGTDPHANPAANAIAPAQVQLPFVMKMKRGRQSRFELVFNGQTAVQIYDGTNGWKLRPFLNRTDVEPYTSEELKASSDAADLDGLLIDYAAKGTKIDVEGLDSVEGKTAYKLKLTLKNGHILHDWIDAQSFLEVKLDGEPRRLDGRMHPVSVFLRDYRKVDGLQIPFLIETNVQGVQRTERILIENVIVNPQFADSQFSKPG